MTTRRSAQRTKKETGKEMETNPAAVLWAAHNVFHTLTHTNTLTHTHTHRHDRRIFRLHRFSSWLSSPFYSLSLSLSLFLKRRIINIRLANRSAIRWALTSSLSLSEILELSRSWFLVVCFSLVFFSPCAASIRFTIRRSIRESFFVFSIVFSLFHHFFLLLGIVNLLRGGD